MSARDPFSRPGDDANLGRALGEYGMARAEESSGDWFPSAQKTVLRICQLYPGREVTGEKLGAAVELVIGRPKAHQTWGSLVSWAKKQGLIRLHPDPDLRRARMEKPRSHGRMTDVYIIVAR